MLIKLIFCTEKKEFINYMLSVNVIEL